MTARYAYDIAARYPYGEEITSTNNDTYKFAQTYRDSDSGLDYVQKRFYASSIGRFLTGDPTSSAGSALPQTWNQYGYAGGDPVNNSDPTGACWSYVDSSGSTQTVCNAVYVDMPDIDFDTMIESQIGSAIAGAEAALGGSGSSQQSAPAPSCSITLFTRGVPFGGSRAQHTYLDVSDPAIGLNDVLEGGPTNPHNAFKHPTAPWGNLEGQVEPVPSNPSSIIKGKNGTKGTFLNGTNPYTNTSLGGETGPVTCSDVIQLVLTVLNYNRGTQVGYAPVPNGTTTFNSNSFTYTLLNDIGLGSAFNSVIGWSPGWGQLVPGLGQP